MSSVAESLSWGHINVNVSDLDRAVAFYKLLGFQVFMPGIPYLDIDNTPLHRRVPDSAAAALAVAPGTRARACIMQLDNGFPKLDLTEFTGGEPRNPPDNQDLGPVRLCLATDDLPAAYQRLLAAGVDFLSPPQPGHNGLADIALCKDPDGTLIELIQIYPERWARLNPDG